MHISEHLYGMPSTVESLGRKLTATNQSMNSLINNNTGLKSQSPVLPANFRALCGGEAVPQVRPWPQAQSGPPGDDVWDSPQFPGTKQQPNSYSGKFL